MLMAGATVNATRQKAGRFVIGLTEPGGVNEPAGTSCAAVMVASRSGRLLSVSQGTAAIALTCNRLHTTVAQATPYARRFIAPSFHLAVKTARRPQWRLRTYHRPKLRSM